MAKKKRPTKKTPENTQPDFNCAPFRTLKGVAVSAPEAAAQPRVAALPEAVDQQRSFAEEMEFLGVDPLDGQQQGSASSSPVDVAPVAESTEEQSDQQLFTESLGRLDVRFDDQVPAVLQPAQPRRMKQLKQGRLRPDASLDLHGTLRHQAVDKVGHFLRAAAHHNWQTLLIVTGRGLHSPAGQTVLRDEVERYLAEDGRSLISEWSRAPRQYGGEGALVVFMKRVK